MPPRRRKKIKKATRFVWHPAVHDLYSQRLTFFIANFGAQAVSEAMDSVSSYLTDMGLPSSNIYAVYGEDDLLIRSWMTPDDQRRIRTHLRDERAWSIEQFECDSVVYSWCQEADPHDLAAEITKNAEKINAVNERGSTLLDESHDVLTLVDAGIIIPVPHRPSTAVKVYIHLHSTSPQHDPRVQSRLVNLVAKLKNVTEATVHRSIDSNILVKLVASGFHDVLPALDAIEDCVGPSQYSSKTLLVASASARDNDTIDEATPPLSMELKLMASTCGPEVEALLSVAPESVRAELAILYRNHVRTFSDASAMGDTRAISALSAVVAYRISNQAERFAELAVAVFPALEGALQDALLRALIDCGGASWFRRFDIANELSDAGVVSRGGGNPSIRDADMGQLTKLIGRFSAKDEELSSTISQALGTDWKYILGRLSPIRNDLTHPRVVQDRSGTFVHSGPFLEWASDFIKVLELFMRASEYGADREGD